MMLMEREAKAVANRCASFEGDETMVWDPPQSHLIYHLWLVDEGTF